MNNFNFVFNPDKIEKIVDFENNMLKEYSQIISQYSDVFAEYGYSLDVGCVWINNRKKIKSSSRIIFQNGYSCYIYCDVLKNGEILCYNANDGEADYYEVSTSWNISYISKSFFSLKVTLCPATDDIKDEMTRLLKTAKNL